MVSLRKFIFVFLFCALLLGCGNQVNDNRFGVIIGDSIAAGNNSLGSRLQHDGQNVYDPSYPNQAGQLSYCFEQYFKMPCFNHGIGGQTTNDIWLRWKRDALGEIYDPEDGRGNKTLPGKPHYIYIHVGINDVYRNVDPNITKANFISMAESCKNNGIKVYFSNIPPGDILSNAQILDIKSMNNWMGQTLTTYGAIVIDEYFWAEDPINPGMVKSEFYSDGVHPTKDGYIELSRFIYSNIRQ